MNYSIGSAIYAYEVSGEGPPVVLLHGFTGSQKTWTHLRDRLTGQFQVITIDLPGHGKTSTPPKTMDQCCDDLIKLFSFLQIKDAHVLGYSMGGRVALSLAIKYPEYVRSLILESSSPGLHSEQEREDRVSRDLQLAQNIKQKGVAWFVDFWENIPLFATQKKLPAQVQQTIRDERLSQQATGLAESLQYMGTGKQPSWWNKIGHVDTPALLVAGEHDHKFVKINEQMAKQMKQAELVVAENAGHAIHVEQPEVFAKIVVSFLKKQNSSQ